MKQPTNSELAQEPGRSSQDESWSALMASAQKGDGKAYGLLLREITPLLRRLSAKAFHNRADVEDAVQDILLTIHTARHVYDPSRPFTPWLVTIARRRIIDKIRATSRRRRQEIELTAEHETFASDETNNRVDESEIRALEAALSTIPERQREAIRLLKLEEKSLKETSELTGHSVGALKLSVHRALKSMRIRMRSSSNGA